MFITIAFLSANIITDVTINKSQIQFGQWVIGIFSFIIGLICNLFYAWYREFSTNGYRINWPFFASLGIIEALSVLMSVIVFWLLDVSINLIWVTFGIMPIVVGSFLLFIGNYKSNGCKVYTTQKEEGSSSLVEKDVVEPLLPEASSKVGD